MKTNIIKQLFEHEVFLFETPIDYHSEEFDNEIHDSLLNCGYHVDDQDIYFLCKYKYEWEDENECQYEALRAHVEVDRNKLKICWEYDWDEGQENVEFYGFIAEVLFVNQYNISIFKSLYDDCK